MTLQRPFTAAPGSYLLEAVVFDRLGEKAGVERTEFTIPGPPDGIWISDIAMVRRTEAMAGAPDPSEPMQYARSRVVPNVARQVPVGTRRLAFFFRLHSDANAAGTNGKLDVDVKQDGNSVAHSSTEVTRSPGSDSSVNLATIQTDALTAGSFRAVFTYTQGDKSTSRDLAFTVDGSRVPGDGSEPEPAEGAGAASNAAADAGAVSPSRMNSTRDASFRFPVPAAPRLPAKSIRTP